MEELRAVWWEREQARQTPSFQRLPECEQSLLRLPCTVALQRVTVAVVT